MDGYEVGLAAPVAAGCLLTLTVGDLVLIATKPNLSGSPAISLSLPIGFGPGLVGDGGTSRGEARQ